MIGTFGDIVFQTSVDRIFTFDEFTRKGAAEFAEHPVMDNKPKLQHTGTGLDEITFTVRLDAALGVNPKTELAKFEAVRLSGESRHLIIGTRVLGRFVLVSLEESNPQLDNKGRLYKVQLNLTLKEDAYGN